jgi:hypothetical protein
LYTAWIKIEDNLPWFELKGTYQTRREAKEAAERFLSDVQVKIVTVTEKPRQIKAVAMIKST